MVREFRKEDENEVRAWYEAHGQTYVGHLPEEGWIEPGIAAGFMYKTDGHFAFIEGMITNPTAPSSDRFEAINEIVKRCHKRAQERGFKQIVALMIKPTLAQRAVEDHGYQVVDVVLLLKKDLN